MKEDIIRIKNKKKRKCGELNENDVSCNDKYYNLNRTTHMLRKKNARTNFFLIDKRCHTDKNTTIGIGISTVIAISKLIFDMI